MPIFIGRGAPFTPEHAYRDLQAAFPRCRVATLICESEESTRRWTSTLKPTSIGCGLRQIPAGTSNKIRSPHPERRQIRTSSNKLPRSSSMPARQAKKLSTMPARPAKKPFMTPAILERKRSMT